MNNQTDATLKDIIYDEFVSLLNVNNIKQFNSECKKKHLDIKNSKQGSSSSEGSRLNKETFIGLMNNIFGKDFHKKEVSLLSHSNTSLHTLTHHSHHSKKEDSKEKMFYSLCEKMFNRFKVKKYEIKSEKFHLHNSHNEYFYVNDIPINYDLQEIDTYEFTCALCMFPKIDFKRKIKLLFEITDADEDGYINEAEIKHMIFVVNHIFSDEEAPLNMNSSIINQSLASIKSQQMFNMIMKYPGQLFQVVTTEKYVDFNQFYEAISKIENFKYTIIPSFIDFKNCLFTKKSEPEFEIDKRNLKDFLAITNEIVLNVKHTNNEIIKNPNLNKDVKKLMESNSESKTEKLTKKKRNYVEENVKRIIHRVFTYNIEHDPNTDSNTNIHESSHNAHNARNSHNTHNSVTPSNSNLPFINSRSGNREKLTALNKNHHSNLNIKDYHSNNIASIPSEVYNINFNKIINLETQPGRIKIKECKDFRDKELIVNPQHITNVNNVTSVNKTESSCKEEKEISKEGYKNTISKLQFSKRGSWSNINKKTFISYTDIMNEIKALSNKKDYANFEDSEEILKLINSAKNTAFALKKKLMDTGTNRSLNFGNFKYNKASVI